MRTEWCLSIAQIDLANPSTCGMITHKEGYGMKCPLRFDESATEKLHARTTMMANAARTANVSAGDCLGSECGWWDDENQVCAILSLAQKMSSG